MISAYLNKFKRLCGERAVPPADCISPLSITMWVCRMGLLLTTMYDDDDDDHHHRGGSAAGGGETLCRVWFPRDSRVQRRGSRALNRNPTRVHLKGGDERALSVV